MVDLTVLPGKLWENVNIWNNSENMTDNLISTTVPQLYRWSDSQMFLAKKTEKLDDEF